MRVPLLAAPTSFDVNGAAQKTLYDADSMVKHWHVFKLL